MSLRAGYFPPQWKVAEVIMISKPDKDPVNVRLYKPISLLPIRTIQKITCPEINACDRRKETNT
jgi:hypothetical protein